MPGETARRCPGCDLTLFLPLSVAVLVAITRPGRAGGPDELLLVRHAYGPTQLWALVAGFVEAGESLEAAAHREVGEEVGLTIGRPAYVDSQPGPSPGRARCSPASPPPCPTRPPSRWWTPGS